MFGGFNFRSIINSKNLFNGSDSDLFSNLDASIPPTASNDDLEGYVVGSIWIDIVSNTAYVCVDNLSGNAIWKANSLEIDDLNSNLTSTWSSQKINTETSNNATNIATKVSNPMVGTFEATDFKTGDVNSMNDQFGFLSTNKLERTGDSMSGNLIMGANKITGLGTPTLDTDAANKVYVDDEVAINANNITINTTDIVTNLNGTIFNANDIATNVGDITTLNTTTGGLDTRLGWAEDTILNIAANASDITTNTTGIATNATAITTNTTGIATNSTAITTNTTGIATNATAITALTKGNYFLSSSADTGYNYTGQAFGSITAEVPGMTTTPTAGTYLVNYSGLHSTSNTLGGGRVELYVDGSAIAYTQRIVRVYAGGEYTDINIMAQVTVDGTEVVEVRYAAISYGIRCSGRALSLVEI